MQTQDQPWPTNPQLSPESAEKIRAAFPAPEQNRRFQEELDLEEQFNHARARGFIERIKAHLHDIGVPPRPQHAVFERIPAEITKIKALHTFPKEPFGLVGPGGCGKSCAIVWSIKGSILTDLLKRGPCAMREFSEYLSAQFKWINWPAMAIEMKNLASRREWNDPKASMLPIIEWIKGDPEKRVLIIDDIGMEKRTEGYTAEQLELLVDVAYNHEAKVFWTSEHPRQELLDLYGYRFTSRLIGLAPDVVLPSSMSDLRVQDQS